MTCPRCQRPLFVDGTCLTHGELSPQPTAEPIVEGEANVPWTEEHWDTTLAMRGKATSHEMGAAIGRTSKAVKNAFARNGYKIARVPGRPRPASPAPEIRHHRPYSDEEILALECGDLRFFGPCRTSRGIYLKAWREGFALRQSEEWMSITDVVRTWEVTRKQVRWMIHKGDLPTRKVNQRVVLLDPGEVEEAMRRRRVEHRKGHRWVR